MCWIKDFNIKRLVHSHCKKDKLSQFSQVFGWEQILGWTCFVLSFLHFHFSKWNLAHLQCIQRRTSQSAGKQNQNYALGRVPLEVSEKMFCSLREPSFNLRNIRSMKESAVPASELHNRSGNVQSALEDSPSVEAVKKQTFVFIIPKPFSLHSTWQLPVPEIQVTVRAAGFVLVLGDTMSTKINAVSVVTMKKHLREGKNEFCWFPMLDAEAIWRHQSPHWNLSDVLEIHSSAYDKRIPPRASYEMCHETWD